MTAIATEVGTTSPSGALSQIFRPMWLRATVLVVLLILAMLLALRLGAVPMTTRSLLDAIAGVGDPTLVTIVRELRLPRAFQAALVGASLAVSGATFQALLRNSLAEPYILGVSSGASTGAVMTVVTGASLRFIWALPLAAFLGAVVAMLLVFRIAFSVGRALDTRVLLLSGVVVSAFLVAVNWLVLSFADTESVRTAIFWMMGSHSGASWRSVSVVTVCLAPALVILLGLARSLNLLAVGESTAAYLGTNVEKIKWIAYGTATLLTAASVSVCGTIGFVGLIVPHAIRLLWGGDNRALLPCSALAGAVFLVSADTVSRTIAGANELPIGVITALVGVPFFVWLLKRPTNRMAV